MDAPGAGEDADPWLRTHGWTLAWAVAVAVATVVVAVSTHEPRMRHSNVLNAVFDSRWMIAGSRVLAATVFAWAMVSIGVRVGRGQWIRTFGPVSSEVREGAEQLVSSQEDLEAQLVAADARIASLREQLREADLRTRQVATMEGTRPHDAPPGGDPA